MRIPTSAKALRAAILGVFALFPVRAVADGIDTEHLFGFMIGSDVGNVGEREFQSQTTGRFGKNGGSYRAIGQELELEFVPARNIRIEVGGTFGSYNILGVPGLMDRSGLSLQGASLDFRYRFLDRDSAPIGLTLALETHAERIDEVSAAKVRSFGTEITLAFDRDLVPNLAVASLNLIYQPEWTRFVGTGVSEQEATVGVAFGVMGQIYPGIFLGGEARYLRRYEGIGMDEFTGQVLFVGPTAYFQLSERSRLTASWSIQAWGRPGGSNATLDLINFERQQARLVFGINF